MYFGKDEIYVIDFVNDLKIILDVFKQYDDGVELEFIQDVNVIYDMKDIFDVVGIYVYVDFEVFK